MRTVFTFVCSQSRSEPIQRCQQQQQKHIKHQRRNKTKQNKRRTIKTKQKPLSVSFIENWICFVCWRILQSRCCRSFILLARLRQPFWLAAFSASDLIHFPFRLPILPNLIRFKDANPLPAASPSSASTASRLLERRQISSLRGGS